MLFIKAYYYIFYAFVLSVVMVCSVLSWLRKPTLNLSLRQRFTFKQILPSLRFHTQAG